MTIRTRFRMALAIKSDPDLGDQPDGERYTALQFAREHDVSETVLHEVLAGKTTSARLEREIDGFIREQLDTFFRHLEEEPPPTGPPVAA